jgi:hypothetical protein
MELIEGNYAPHVGATITHGNAGYLTYLRNYSSSQFASPPVWGSTAAQTGNVTAIQFQDGDINMNVLGNVLGTAAVSTAYEVYNDSSVSSIFELGSTASDVSVTSLLRHGNYDYVTKSTIWSSSIATQTVPASLYRTAKPAWWPATSPWPWTGPDLTPMVGVLPAKARSDSLGSSP